VRGFIAGLLALAAGAAARADEPRVVSPRPDSVSVTIYRDLFALVTETRTVDLPEGPVTLVLDGVVETLLPQSAVIADTGRAPGESDFDFERLTPANLLRHSIGDRVLLTRSSPATGKVRQVPATLVAANTGGVVFRTDDGNEALRCSGLPERLVLEHLPGDLHARPTLSIRLAAGPPGRRTVRVSYLAQGFAWSADYLGKLDSEGAHMDLSGWITLRNLTDATFRDAQVQVVAGNLNLLDADEERGTSTIGASTYFGTDEAQDERRKSHLEDLLKTLDEEPPGVVSLGGCYPLGADYAAAEDLGRFPDRIVPEAVQRLAGVVSSGSEELEEVVIEGFRSSMALRENLADYQLYRLPVRTDLKARQTKQVAFVHKPAVKIGRIYGFRVADEDDEDQDLYEEGDGDWIRPRAQIEWTNSDADGLGEPLPAGRVRIFDPLFAGEADIRDNPVGEQAQIRIGSAQNIAFSVQLPGGEEPQIRWTTLLTRRVYLPVEFRIVNDKPVPVTMEIRQGAMYDFETLRVKNATLAPHRKAGDYAWRFTIAAHGEARLGYVITGRVPDDDKPSLALREIYAFRTFETGQPDLVCSAICWNVRSSMPGIFATHTRSLCVIAKPSPTFSSRTDASVCMDSAVKPALPRPSDSAIEKQAACAAPMSSSGFVPGPSSKRALKP
jgi:hypothetical protein